MILAINSRVETLYSRWCPNCLAEGETCWADSLSAIPPAGERSSEFIPHSHHCPLSPYCPYLLEFITTMFSALSSSTTCSAGCQLPRVWTTSISLISAKRSKVDKRPLHFTKLASGNTIWSIGTKSKPTSYSINHLESNCIVSDSHLCDQATCKHSSVI